ncbi:hypothetical protein [Asanoa siamensis]|uniref:DUF1579 domain-containing protein n=1 Tax=Asanoa siamensis TaxID=926357 RepID=A0ABQ4CQS3_9ACTN|nr:hypothetical protein [Asanoa siamensis]GIF73637.1 hypothetical protein Asi02nite_31550 [Asanoa siamensis]
MRNDFDFFVGSWTSHHRRLREILAGSDEWYEFEGVSRSWSVFDGAGNIDEITFPTEGWGGVTMRLYDEARDEWSLYWASSRTGLALPPVVGRFENGVGTFTGDEEFAGQPITVRFTWSDITADSCRWEQAFSPDKGATWETNWVMEFTRTAP